MPTKQASKSSATGKGRNVWTDEERAAMQESARERKAASRRSPGDDPAEGAQDLQESIAKMPADDRAMAEGIHALVTERRAVAHAEDVLRDAGVRREGRQGDLLLSSQVEVQGPLLDLRLSARGQPRRRRHVADRLRGDSS